MAVHKAVREFRTGARRKRSGMREVRMTGGPGPIDDPTQDTDIIGREKSTAIIGHENSTDIIGRENSTDIIGHEGSTDIIGRENSTDELWPDSR